MRYIKASHKIVAVASKLAIGKTQSFGNCLKLDVFGIKSSNSGKRL